MIKNLSIKTGRQGLHEITQQLEQVVSESGLQEGLCTVFIRHTSASLLIQENADPLAKNDLEKWLNRLVPENDPLYTHIMEGVDDMPAHIKSTLTASSISIPLVNNRLVLGTWQGVFLWEHRYHASSRQLIIHLGD